MKVSVRFAGMGGQGIIFAGIILARAVSLYEKKEGRDLYAIQTQSHGPAARGESSKCDVVISDEESFYPFVEKPDYLVLMSQPAYEIFLEQTYPGTIVILDEDLVEGKPELTHYDVPALRRAKGIGSSGSTNMVMLGVFANISGIVSSDSILKAIEDVSPMGTAEANEVAFREGYALGRTFHLGG